MRPSWAWLGVRLTQTSSKIATWKPDRKGDGFWEGATLDPVGNFVGQRKKTITHFSMIWFVIVLKWTKPPIIYISYFFWTNPYLLTQAVNWNGTGVLTGCSPPQRSQFQKLSILATSLLTRNTNWCFWWPNGKRLMSTSQCPNAFLSLQQDVQWIHVFTPGENNNESRRTSLNLWWLCLGLQVGKSSFQIFMVEFWDEYYLALFPFWDPIQLSLEMSFLSFTIPPKYLPR